MAPDVVSVIIPSFNYARFVTEAVASALAQGYPHREIIVIDDGSTDDTRRALEPYEGQIRYIFQPNQGLSAARNTGIRAATGEFIALLDADDQWHPRKLELQLGYLRQHPETDLLATESFMDYKHRWPAIDERADVVAVKYGLEDVLGRARFAPSSVVVRRRCLDVAGLFDPELRCVEDRDMWIRLASRFVLAKLPLPLLWYRVHPDSLSNKATRMEEAELHVLRRAFAANPALQGRWLLRRKTFGQAAFASGQTYGANRQWRAGIGRVVRSLLLWPLPFRRDDTDVSCTRTRMLIGFGLRMLGLVAPEAAPGQPAGSARAGGAGVPPCELLHAGKTPSPS
jgi:glycosyltransferase involved in cell wall biosynthesis